MSNFRNEDFVYYALKAKPITKKSKRPKNVVKIVATPSSSYELDRHASRKATNFLKPVDLMNKPFSTSKVQTMIKNGQSNHQESLMEMQMAVREQ